MGSGVTIDIQGAWVGKMHGSGVWVGVARVTKGPCSVPYQYLRYVFLTCPMSARYNAIVICINPPCTSLTLSPATHRQRIIDLLPNIGPQILARVGSKCRLRCLGLGLTLWRTEVLGSKTWNGRSPRRYRCSLVPTPKVLFRRYLGRRRFWR